MKNRFPVNQAYIKTALAIALLSFITCNLFGEELFRKVSFLNKAFSVMVPSDWSKRNDLNDTADLQIANLYKEAYMIVISENKSDFQDISLRKHSDLTRALIRNSLTNYNESKPEYFDKGNLKVLRYQLTGTINNINVVYWHVTFESKNHYHQMLLWSLDSKFSANKANFNTVIESFKAEY